MPRVIVSVTNDLTTDNRVDKVCRTLVALGWEVLLVGRLLPDSLPLNRTYTAHRMRLFFRKGFLFYAEYNFRLFLFLLFRQADVLHSNDLDTLLPNCLAGWIKSIPVVYDSHEYFTGVPEIMHRPVVQKTWEWIEGRCFHQPVAVFTVNEGIAELYRKKYGRNIGVMRNIPERVVSQAAVSRNELGLPDDRFILILQGAGINIHRGSEEMLEAMRYLDDSYLLLIVGNGDVVPWLREKTAGWGLQNRVQFLPRMPYAEMIRYTAAADLGLTLDKPGNINYLYSLPNKVFDYIRAGIPVLASNLPEVANIINTYKVGCLFEKHEPEELARIVRELRQDEATYRQFRKNTAYAGKVLSWEFEAEGLREVYLRLARS